MLYLKKVKEILEGSQMSLRCKVFRFSIKLRKVFIVFSGEIVKCLGQTKRYILSLGIGQNKVRWKRYNLDHDIVRFTKLLLDVRDSR